MVEMRQQTKTQTEPRDEKTMRPQSLREIRSHIEGRCVDCPTCRSECAFLKKYGTPGEIAISYDSADNKWLMMAYECSLCGLCAAVCPVGLRPDAMFLEMRREAVDRGLAPLAEHRTLLSYERRGASKRFTWYALPRGCQAIFFPGCALPGTRPVQTKRIFEYLQKHDPTLGIVLDCCCCPSHDLGRSSFFTAMFDEMKSYLINQGVKRIITACPNCHRMFRLYGAPLEAVTVYEMLVQWGVPETEGPAAFDTGHDFSVSVHDPCGVRMDKGVHAAVRKLAADKGFSIVEMVHAGTKTLCCGEGGNAGAVAPGFAAAWTERRCAETGDRFLLTYCAGCAAKLGGRKKVCHILDAVLDPQAVISGKVNVSRSPMTYFNRLRLKRYMQKQNPDGTTRERTYSADQPTKGKGWRRIILLLVLAAIIGVANAYGGTRLLNPDFLRQWVQSWGVFAPVLYILIYTIAPVLFLPGLPITIAGGIIFGPVWGVVYSITGATLGACAAFLVARYAAGSWVRQRLTSPRWKTLDEGVFRHGWKIVAFTRLIPVFPFNMLNYAFGLTAIPFGHYAVTSFICMLPGCVAFIVFSSSLPDLIRGRISPAFALGLVLILALMLLPTIYRYARTKKSSKTGNQGE